MRVDRNPWKAEEVDELKRRYLVDRYADIAKDLGRGVGSVCGKAFGLGLVVPAEERRARMSRGAILACAQKRAVRT